MRAERLEMVSALVAKASGYYARRVWWVDRQDLTQEAWAIALGCTLPDSTTDDHFRGYTYKAIAKSLSRYCWAQSSIASAANPGKFLEGVSRVGVSGVIVLSENTNPEFEVLKQEASMLLPYLQDKLRERMSVLAGADISRAAGALLVLLDGVEPVDAAAQTGVSSRYVYNWTEKMKVRAREDSGVRHILFNIDQRRGDLASDYQPTNYD